MDALHIRGCALGKYESVTLPPTNVLVTEHPFFLHIMGTCLWECGASHHPFPPPNSLSLFPTHSSHRVFGHMLLVIIEFRERLG